MRLFVPLVISVFGLSTGTYDEYVEELKKQADAALPKMPRFDSVTPESLLQTSSIPAKRPMTSAEFSAWLNNLYHNVESQRKQTMQLMMSSSKGTADSVSSTPHRFRRRKH